MRPPSSKAGLGLAPNSCYSRAAIKNSKHGAKTYDVKGATSLESPDAPRGDLAFVALDDEHSKRYVPRLLELGYRVIDKSNTYRGDAKVPLVAAGVNHDLVTNEVRLVANPNCTTIPLVLALWPLHQRFGLSAATVSTYQAVSGAAEACGSDQNPSGGIFTRLRPGQRFQREAEVLASLNHPNIAAIYRLVETPTLSPALLEQFQKRFTVLRRLPGRGSQTKQVRRQARHGRSGRWSRVRREGWLQGCKFS